MRRGIVLSDASSEEDQSEVGGGGWFQAPTGGGDGPGVGRGENPKLTPGLLCWGWWLWCCGKGKMWCYGEENWEMAWPGVSLCSPQSRSLCRFVATSAVVATYVSRTGCKG